MMFSGGRIRRKDLIPREVNLLSALKTFDSWHDTQSSIAMSTHFWSFKLDQYVTKKQNCWFHDLEKLDTLWFKYPNIFKSRYNFVSPNDISHYHTTVQYIFCSSGNLWITIQCAGHHWMLKCLQKDKLPLHIGLLYDDDGMTQSQKKPNGFGFGRWHFF